MAETTRDLTGAEEAQCPGRRRAIERDFCQVPMGWPALTPGSRWKRPGTKLVQLVAETITESPDHMLRAKHILARQTLDGGVEHFVSKLQPYDQAAAEWPREHSGAEEAEGPVPTGSEEVPKGWPALTPGSSPTRGREAVGGCQQPQKRTLPAPSPPPRTPHHTPGAAAPPRLSSQVVAAAASTQPPPKPGVDPTITACRRRGQG